MAAHATVVQEGDDPVARELRGHEPLARREGAEICEELQMGASTLRCVADTGELLLNPIRWSKSDGEPAARVALSFGAITAPFSRWMGEGKPHAIMWTTRAHSPP